MEIKKLLKNFININKIPNIYISGISYDIEKIQYNNLFFLLNNKENNNYNNIINKLISKGIRSIVKETDIILNDGIFFFKYDVLIIYMYKLRNKLSKIFLIYNNYKLKYLNKNYNLIGITGTNGKTTISFFVYELIKLFKKQPYLISTLGNGNIDNLNKTKYTTDLPFEFFNEIYNSIINHKDYIISEITSHSLDQNRIKHAKFYICIFTNITHDHLDYHKNIINYKVSKLKLFNDYLSNFNIINYDDNLGKEIYNNFSNKTFIVSSKNINDTIFDKCKYWLKLIYIKKINNYNFIKISSNFGNGYFKTKINENFNIENLLMSISCLLLLNFKLHKILKFINYLKLPNGRFNIIKNKKNKDIIIDYAHTPDSIEKLFLTIKNNYLNDKICTIFGFGGNRDRFKREIIYNIILKYSDYFIITSDNSRNERFKDIISFIKKNNKIKIIYNRELAIKYSLKFYNKENILLIIGKGHEEYQILYKNKRVYHSDILIVKNNINKNCD